MRSRAISGLCLVGVSVLALVTVAAQQKPDPRVGLKAGLHDAGEAAWNLERIVNLPKPEGFFDPKAPAGSDRAARWDRAPAAPDCRPAPSDRRNLPASAG